MTRQEHLLTILGEECAEVSQMVSKTLRFGTKDKAPDDHMDNANRILQEFYEAATVIEMLQSEGILPRWYDDRISFQKVAKAQRVDDYLNYSEKVGTLNT